MPPARGTLTHRSRTTQNNLYRCCLGAAGTAFVDPLINAMGAGWAFTFLSLLNCCFVPLILLEWKHGMRWRAERAARLQVANAKADVKALEAGRALERKREGEKEVSH